MISRAYNLYTDRLPHSKLLIRGLNLWSSGKKKIDPSAQIGRGTQIHGDVRVGASVSIADDCQIFGDVDIGEGTNLNGRNVVRGQVSIGKYCAIAARARMRTEDHPTDRPAVQTDFYDRIGSRMDHVSKGRVSIGNDVWICSDAKILSGVTIGDGAVIAADSVVVDDIEPYSLVAGNPARHKRYRFDAETREALREIEWWNWSKEKQRKNRRFFESNLREVEDVHGLVVEE